MGNCSIPLREALIRVIDTEGTDREPARSKVCEVAWRDVDFDGAVTATFSTLINPGIEIPPSSSAIHHIVDADVADAPRFDAIADIVVAEVFAAHGASYDSTVLGLDEWPWICTHRLAKHLWPWIENHSNQEIRYTLKLTPDLPKDTASHRAAADAAVTAAILQAGLPLAVQKWPDIVTVDDLIKHIKAPALLIRIPFKTARGGLFEHADTDHLEWIVRTGAGGEDCVYTAQHWLEKRYAAASDQFRDAKEDE